MFWLTRVRSHSMAPTLADGRLALTRSLRRTATPRRGDVVVADSAELGERVVKRVIGLPGETVTFAGGAVAIDGQRLIEPYAAPSTYRGQFRVPAGHYLLLGDNRDRSNDSRSWRQPFLPRSAIRSVIVSRALRGSCLEAPARGEIFRARWRNTRTVPGVESMWLNFGCWEHVPAA